MNKQDSSPMTFSIYASTDGFFGHVWFSVTDDDNFTMYYHVSSFEDLERKLEDELQKSKLSTREGITYQEIAKALFLLLESFWRILLLLVGREDFYLREFVSGENNKEHDIKIDIPIDELDLAKIDQQIEYHLKNPTKYQIIGQGLFNRQKQNCCSNTLEILEKAGLSLDNHLTHTPQSWAERIKSPASLVARGIREFEKGNALVSLSNEISDRGEPDTFLYRMTKRFSKDDPKKLEIQ